jgi:hypothetical protein
VDEKSHSNKHPTAILSVRTALILLLAVISATVAGLLTWLSKKDGPEAALAAFVTLAGATTFFNCALDR